MTGTKLYHDAIAYDYGDSERKELIATVWKETPWMVDAYTDSPNTDRRRQIMEWCREQFGPEAWPIHGPGNWQLGCAIIYGWTWMGFATEDQLKLFMQAWPAPMERSLERAGEA